MPDEAESPDQETTTTRRQLFAASRSVERPPSCEEDELLGLALEGSRSQLLLFF
jgi:hypothetical protein